MGCYEKTKIKGATLLFPRHAYTNEKSPSEINDQMFPIQAQHCFINQSLRKKSREKERGEVANTAPGFGGKEKDTYIGV